MSIYAKLLYPSVYSPVSADSQVFPYLSPGSFWGPTAGLLQRTGRCTPRPPSPLHIRPPSAEERTEAPLIGSQPGQVEEVRLRLQVKRMKYSALV